MGSVNYMSSSPVAWDPPLIEVPTVTKAELTGLPVRGVRHNFAEYRGRALDAAAPLAVRQHNLTLVSAAFDEAGVPYFAVPGLDDLTSCLAVTLMDRDRACAVLRRLCQETDGYMSILHPVPPVRQEPRAGGDKEAWEQAGDPRVVRLNWYWTDPDHKLSFGPEHGCDVEFWRRDAKVRLISPRPNRVTRVVPVDGASVEVEARRFTRLLDGAATTLPPVRSRQEFSHTTPDAVEFPVDVVYTWVDGTDAAWQRRRAECSGEVYHVEAASDARYISRDELKYSLRSVHQNAPWVRNVYIVTDDQTPPWLNTDDPRVRVVDHREIFSDPSVLPVFNSHAIESQLHHIPGLSDQFLYFNDDMFLGRPLTPQRFFEANGLSRFFFAGSHVPLGPITENDTPVDAACKNNRELLRDKFGKTISQTFQHVPYPLRRDVMFDIEKDFEEAHQRTAASRFRALTDLSIPSSFQHYYAYFTGRATPGKLQSVYIQLAVADLRERLDRLLARRDADAFCLNDAYSTPEDMERQNSLLLPFLESYFPVPSPFEKNPGASP
ncbi:stealth family protein [Stackebrandtia nassauensis]|uniref:UDP-N-acetylglucosamine--lysosomal-enzyme N-acetylglucosamine phosphotransferase n=1 Tax=Stackebrandtia nassauensis (strain DSM 44728 / CIP 108903 / NRRL B-16338 / NBRC 102104 / LLR-40K-21) TaxID=446470 RepID=D3PXX4_STANL|nr:stealth family protein [Stackebrandtia nassauensis]ADD45303.1 UDP-N-acetylglucosamine--lysosomal-enzyme N-acetylglucosamine phosphotransferase [Stackebrandtia nassauensis DSM 44728]